MTQYSVKSRLRLFALRSIPFVLSVGLLVPLAGLSQSRGQQPLSSRDQARLRMIEKLKTKQTKPFDQPNEALQFFWAKRSPTGEAMSVSELAAAAQAVAEMPVFNRASAGAHTTSVPLTSSTAAVGATGTLASAWQPHGPGNIGGRSRALLVHRTQNNLMWTAGVAGGVWKSTDSGASWTPKGDLLVNIAVNSLIEDPAQDEVLYAGTGEGFFNADAVRGQGIFKSSDYGETWAQLSSTNNPDFFYVQKLAATRHKKKQRIYAATRTGVFRSTNGGSTWTKVLNGIPVNGCFDLAIQYHQQDAAGAV